MAIRVIEYASEVAPTCSALLAQILKSHEAIEQLIPELSPDEFEWQPLMGCNTIGMLLGHVAAVEGYWVAVASRRFQSDEEIETFLRTEIGLGVTDDGMPPGPDGLPPALLEGKPGSYFVSLMRAAGRVLADESQGWRDALLWPSFEWGGDTLNVAWILYHLVAHTSYHFGQINQLRRFYRLANAELVQPEPGFSSRDPG